jgi:hypothetical protein
LFDFELGSNAMLLIGKPRSFLFQKYQARELDAL